MHHCKEAGCRTTAQHIIFNMALGGLILYSVAIAILYIYLRWPEPEVSKTSEIENPSQDLITPFRIETNLGSNP